MRWSIIRLIAARETRDQLRDRRTLFLILGLPILMYPLFVGVGILYVAEIKRKKLTVGVVGAEFLPKPKQDLTPLVGGAGGTAYKMRTYPILFDSEGQLSQDYSGNALDAAPLIIKSLDVGTDSAYTDSLTARQFDAIIVIDTGTASQLERGERASIRVLGRDGEENSKLAVQRITSVLQHWADHVKMTQFARHGLPPDFDRPIVIRDPQSAKSPEKKIADDLRDMLVKVIPFLLVMWMLTGSIYPAIDMTAGEKERGTMETLLISPAERIEIVAGKFIATATFGFATAMWNVLLMVLAVAVAQAFFPYSLLSLPGLLACIVAAVPLAMLFAAVALTLGIFARSTKEGNYYMVPLFFIALPLAYWSMTPGIELDSFTRWMPMANALLFQQRLMSVRPEPFPWQHAPAVFGTLLLCVSFALWAAVRQFHREGVLFRESETVAKGGWSLFGKK